MNTTSSLPGTRRLLPQVKSKKPETHSIPYSFFERVNPIKGKLHNLTQEDLLQNRNLCSIISPSRLNFQPTDTPAPFQYNIPKVQTAKNQLFEPKNKRVQSPNRNQQFENMIERKRSPKQFSSIQAMNVINERREEQMNSLANGLKLNPLESYKCLSCEKKIYPHLQERERVIKEFYTDSTEQVCPFTYNLPEQKLKNVKICNYKRPAVTEGLGKRKKQRYEISGMAFVPPLIEEEGEGGDGAELSGSK